jgi:hypothetical protein
MTANGPDVRLADGSERQAREYPWGEYECPWCQSPVISPEGHNQRELARIRDCQRAGREYQPGTYYGREAWEARGCQNPACLVNMTLPRLQAWREEEVLRAAELERRAAVARWHQNYQAETAAREEAAWIVIRDQALAAGQCVDCLRSSYWQTRPHLVKHRDPENCPHRRRYAA